MKLFDWLYGMLTCPEKIEDLKHRVDKLEEQRALYHAREPKVFVVADEQKKMIVK